MRRGIIPAIAVTALLGLYVWAVVGKAIDLINTGTAVGIGIGAAVLVIPLLIIWLIAKEWALALTVQRMADTLADAGELPVDDLPRSPGGRVDRASADAVFALHKADVDQSPESWRAWYNLAFAYDAAHDRSRARATLRHAAKLFKSSPR